MAARHLEAVLFVAIDLGDLGETFVAHLEKVHHLSAKAFQSRQRGSGSMEQNIHKMIASLPKDVMDCFQITLLLEVFLSLHDLRLHLLFRKLANHELNEVLGVVFALGLPCDAVIVDKVPEETQSLQGKHKGFTIVHDITNVTDDNLGVLVHALS